MGLAETLGARAARTGRSAPVECGELGVLTVESLPVRELELLLRGPDGRRAVFYAACRDVVRLADVLGHSSIETTRIYLLSTAKESARQLDRLNLLSGWA